MRYCILLWLTSLWLGCGAPAPLQPAPIAHSAEALASDITEPAPWGSAAGTGTWVYHPVAAPAGGDYAVEFDLRVDIASTTNDPVHQMGAFAVYNNQENIGGYEAGVSLRKNGASQYRIMISSHWGEALLWSSRGGILQVRPFNFVAGTTYHLRASANGPHIVLQVNGQTLLELYDQTAPIALGGIALGRKEGTVWFGAATTSGLPPEPPPAPQVHQPNFTVRAWKGLQWGFDGDEPIFAIGAPPDEDAPELGCVGFEVKLVPGYTAQLYIPWYLENWVSEAFSASTLKQLTVTAQGATLGLVLDCQDPVARPDLGMRTTITVGYDSGAYTYDHQSQLTISPGYTLGVSQPIDITDPGFYNGVQSGSPQGATWPDPHPWSVYQQEQGALYKEPANHVGWYPGYGLERWWQARMDFLAPTGYWAIVGDPIANPVLSLQGPPTAGGTGDGAVDGLRCGWGYDLHLQWVPAGTTLSPGTYSINWRLTSVAGTTGDALLKSAGYALPTDLSATWLLYTGGVGHVEHFDQVVLQASPFGEMPWGDGGLQDRTVGHGDSTSMRIAGPFFAGNGAGADNFMESIDPGTSYEVSVWVKTSAVQGEGPGIEFGGQPYYPRITGTNGWQHIGFVTVPAAPLDIVPFTLHNSGSGQVWFDDFLIRPVTVSQPADPGMSLVPVPIANPQTAIPDTGLLWGPASEVADGTVLDLSGHGSHGALQGATQWVDDTGGRVLQFSTSADDVIMPGHSSVNFGTQVTLELWFNPGTFPTPSTTLVSGGIESNDLWRIVLMGATPPYLVAAELPMGPFVTSSAVVTGTGWTHLALSHDGQQMALYVNGALVKSGPAPGVWLGTGAQGYLRFGASVQEDNLYGNYVGRIANPRLYTRVLSPSEIAADAAAGVFP